MERICPTCGTANEHDYTYCKNCGAALPESKPIATNTAAEENGEEIVCRSCNTVNSAKFNFCRRCGASLHGDEAVSNETIDGVPVSDLKAFVGPNGDRIVGKWQRGFTFCWPVAILTALFGAAGAAFWFLYRRMYKIGIILLAVALLSTVIAGALIIPPLADVREELSSNEALMSAVTEYMQTGDYARYANQLASIINRSPELFFIMSRFQTISNAFTLAEIVFLLVIGFFALNLYKNFAVKKLRQFANKPTALELSLSGGTSGGSLAVGILVYVMLSISLAVLFALGLMMSF